MSTLGRLTSEAQGHGTLLRKHTQIHLHDVIHCTGVLMPLVGLFEGYLACKNSVPIISKGSLFGNLAPAWNSSGKKGYLTKN